MLSKQSPAPLTILLADDNRDDSFLFDKALKELSMPTVFIPVADGEKLMAYLTNNSEKLPDVLFLDLNMPRINGSECLSIIKRNAKLKHLPVIIYSTSMNKDVIDLFYKFEAHYYVLKRNYEELVEVLHHILTTLVENNFARPPKDQFVLNRKDI